MFYRAFYLMHHANRWLQLRLEFLGALIVGSVALLIVISREAFAESLFPTGMTIGLVGLSLNYTGQVTGLMNWAVRMGCECEARMTSVERMQEYARIAPEEPMDAAAVEAAAAAVGDKFPTAGAIRFEKVAMRYRDGLPLVLNGVTLDIPAGSKVGICGRTGSGSETTVFME